MGRLRGLATFTSNGKSGLIFFTGLQISTKSSYIACGTEIPIGGVGPPSRLNRFAIFPNSFWCVRAYAFAPSKPNSSPAKAMNRMVRLGFAPERAISRAASIIGPIPVPQSIPPVATSNASRWPLIITYSSGYFVPFMEATTLWYFTGPSLKWLRISNSNQNSRRSFAICSITAYWCSSNLISHTSGKLSKVVFLSFTNGRS